MLSSEMSSWSHRALRKHFLDAHVNDTESGTLDAVARMVLEIDRPDHVLHVGLRTLSAHLGAGRVDVGFGTAQQRTFSAAAEVSVSDDVPKMVGRALPNRHEVLQRVWHSAQPVAYDDVVNNPMVASLKEAFLECAAHAMLAQRLSNDAGSFGVICIDDVEYGRVWRDCDRAYVYDFCTTFFAPLITISRQIAEPDDIVKPSPSELDAIRLAAQGLSYKAIAATLNKSIRTIEAQLRSARHKTNTGNQTELVRVCEPWL
ncbi:MAG: LuxR C-terminal-related transcriptional regulator [Bradymonadia bacterium]